MDPVVQSAVISAGATVLGIGATATVAIAGFRYSRSASEKALASARETNQATIEAARADVQATLETTRDGQIADLYGKAIEQLGSDKLDVRIGGIYALERIARDSDRDHPTVMEVLSAFVREHSHEQWPPVVPGTKTLHHTTRPDVQAALTVLGRRNPDRDVRPIDLSRANLTGADLRRTNLIGANLRWAELIVAHIEDADLTDARLYSADLTSAFLIGANLTGADLTGADLTGAQAINADFTDARLINARLTGADLGGARLTSADLTSADLTSADLTGMDLTDMDFTDTELTDTDLTDTNLTGAKWPRDAPVPVGWELDTSSGRLNPADTGSGPAEGKLAPASS